MIPLWAFAPTIRCWSSARSCMQFMVQGAWGVIPAHINELSPDSVRGFLPGFAYQCGVAVAGTASRFKRRSDTDSYANAMAGTALTVFAAAAVIIALGREKHATEFGLVRAKPD